MGDCCVVVLAPGAVALAGDAGAAGESVPAEDGRPMGWKDWSGRPDRSSGGRSSSRLA